MLRRWLPRIGWLLLSAAFCAPITAMMVFAVRQEVRDRAWAAEYLAIQRDTLEALEHVQTLASERDRLRLEIKRLEERYPSAARRAKR